MQRRLVLAYVVVLVSGAGLAGAAAWGVFHGGGNGGCGAVGTSTQDAARAVTESFVRDVRKCCFPLRSCSLEVRQSGVLDHGANVQRK